MSFSHGLAPALERSTTNCPVGGGEKRDNGRVRISAKEDYGVRALIELAAAERPLTREQIAEAQDIPMAFLQNILVELRHAELVEAQRGRDGGFRLARSAREITIADVVRAVSGPLATVRGVRPPNVTYNATAEPLRDVWIALRANIRRVLEQVTLADLAGNHLPRHVARLATDPASLE
jgi:Rrf2 family protein